MHIGMPTLIELETLEENVEMCTKLGLDFIEINMNLPNYQVDVLNINHLTELQKKYNIFFTFHLEDSLDIASFNPDILEATFRTIFKTLLLASHLNSPIVNLHMQKGIPFTLPNKKIYVYEKYKTHYLNNIYHFSKKISQQLNSSQTLLCIENTGIYSHKSITEGIDILLQQPKLSLTWDIGHDYLSSWQDSDYITFNLDNVRHMHIHDAKKEHDHLELFKGNINLLNYLEFACISNISAVIEVKTPHALKQSVASLKALNII